MDKIEIINLALARIGVAAIERLDEPSEAARQAKAFYELTRRAVLSQYHWSFATRRVSLALVPTELKDYKFVYRYPMDALYVRRVYMMGSRKPWDKKHYKIISDNEGKLICSRQPFAEVEYTADITDTTLFDDAFIEAFSWKLAAEIAFTLTGKPDLALNAQQNYRESFTEAVGEDAAEYKEPEEYVNRLAMARFWG